MIALFIRVGLVAAPLDLPLWLLRDLPRREAGNRAERRALRRVRW